MEERKEGVLLGSEVIRAQYEWRQRCRNRGMGLKNNENGQAKGKKKGGVNVCGESYKRHSLKIK